MKADTAQARQLLGNENYTCVLIHGTEVHTSRERGVKPLLALLDSGTDMAHFCAADKVVGKAAAMLYVLLGIDELWAGVISAAALPVLAAHGIPVEYDHLTEGIRNRTDTGSCPMEEAVRDAVTPEEGLAAIRSKLAALERQSGV